MNLIYQLIKDGLICRSVDQRPDKKKIINQNRFKYSHANLCLTEIQALTILIEIQKYSSRSRSEETQTW